MDKGMKSVKECYQECKATGGCTAFDTRDPNKKKYHCFLFGHSDVQPALALDGVCYKITGPIAAQSGSDKDRYAATDTISTGLSKLGKGACRGQGWAASSWPMDLGLKTLPQCAELCSTTQGCTAFDVRAPDEQTGKKQSSIMCTLYGHPNVIPASGVPADCYAAPMGQYKPKSEGTNKPKKKKEYKIPVFKDPKILDDDPKSEDDEWLFEPPPAEVRSRAHIDELLHANAISDAKLEEAHLKELKKIYETSIKPLETIYKYKELSNRHFGDPEIFNKPLVVLMGPWSGGKSTMINYFLGTEYTTHAFRAGKGHVILWNFKEYAKC